jgi:hypothetical protein
VPQPHSTVAVASASAQTGGYPHRGRAADRAARAKLVAPDAGPGFRRTLRTAGMTRRALIASTLAVALIVAAWAARLAPSHAVPNLAGHWQSWRSEMQISQNGDLFRIDISNPNGLLGGTYSGKFRDDAIHVTGPLAPLCGEMVYTTDTHKLDFCGEEFARARR